MYEAVVEEKEMPPAGLPQLTQEELDAFACWKKVGFLKLLNRFFTFISPSEK
jgi:hypothetical protein